MNERIYTVIVMGGMGKDNCLTDFGDTLETLDLMYLTKEDNLEYNLLISHNVKKNAEKKEIWLHDFNKFFLQQWFLSNRISKFTFDSKLFSEWDIIEQIYPNIELIEEEFKDIEASGLIILKNPEHIIRAEHLYLK